MNRIPTLDGWRGIAILLVLFEHMQSSLNLGYLPSWKLTGQHGVTIFFVLSGYLITSKLLEEPFHLKRFYIRRFFRLMPVAWVYLAAIVVFGALYHVRVVSWRESASCVFFYRNFQEPGYGVFARHFWSLSLEEQFYLVWPCILAFTGRRMAARVAVIGGVACATWRLLHWSYYNRTLYDFQTQVRADALLVGCLLALAMSSEYGRLLIAAYARYWALPSIGWLVYCICHYPWLPPLSESLAIAGLICACVVHARSPFVKWLDDKRLAWIGKISYSIYVWQQFFFLPRPGNTLTIAMMCIMPVFAIGSYYWIERPATRLGHRLTRSIGPNKECPASPVAV